MIYTVLRKVGEGTFAEIYQGEDGSSGSQVALKRIRGIGDEKMKKAAEAEVAVMKRVGDHVNVLKLLDVYHEKEKIYLVLPWCEWDLDKVIVHSETKLDLADCKCYAGMLLKALEHCHERNVVHRDIKANNVLIGADHQIKLADFGSAKIHDGTGKDNDNEWTAQIGTRYYRAPEIMFGKRDSDYKIDVWAAGCLIGEMIKRAILFQGESDIDQLCKIFSVLGSPTDEQWPSMRSLPFFLEFKQFQATPLKQHLFREDCPTNEQVIDLLQGLLTFDPEQRPTATVALAHPFFQSDPPPTPLDALQMPPVGFTADNPSLSSESSLSSWETSR